MKMENINTPFRKSETPHSVRRVKKLRKEKNVVDSNYMTSVLTIGSLY